MKLVWNKSDCTLELNGLTVTAAPPAYPPFKCQAFVEEQDTHLILGEQTVLKDPGKPTWYLARSLEHDNVYPLGSVIVRGKTTLQLLAVVHDLDQEPSNSAETVTQVYQAILQVAQERKLTSIALPLLATVHGKLSDTESAQLLYNVLRQGYPQQLRQIWLILGSGGDSACLTVLSQLKRE